MNDTKTLAELCELVESQADLINLLSRNLAAKDALIADLQNRLLTLSEDIIIGGGN